MRKSLWLAGLSSLLAVGCSKDPRTAPLLPPCTASGSSVNRPLPGDYAAISPTAIKGCYVFPAAPAGSAVEYLLVPQAASGIPNDSQSFKLQATALALAGIEAERMAPEAVPVELSPADQFHLFLRQSERRRSYPIPPRPERAPEAQLAARAFPPPPRRPYTPADSGDTNSFKVCGTLDCKGLQPVDAALMKIGQHIALYVDISAPPQGLSQADLDALRTVFDTRLYTVDRNAFGVESDIDGNGVVIVLMTNKVNELVPAPCTGGFVAGYFFGADIDPGFATSYNNGEVFYSIVADPAPATLKSCAHSVADVNRIVPVTFVHEFQHMISYNEHVLVRRGDGEILWLNEALSHYAEERGGRSFLPADSLSFCRYVAGDLSNAGKYLQAPQSYFLVDTSGIGGLAERGAYWLFLRYLIDQYAADTSLLNVDVYTQTLVKTGTTGVTNVVQRANNTPFATLLSHWSLANWVSDLPGFTAPPELTYKTWAFRSAYPLFNQGRPWQCTTGLPPTFPLAPGVGPGSALSLSAVLRAGSGVYHRAQQGAGTPGFTLLFSDASGRALRTSLLPQLNIIRVQ
jgi:hypothetical protein